jgi:glycosyltransferase involved in cell wall biosynthesis
MELSSVSVVVPVYNSEAILGELIVRLEPVLRTYASAFEVVLINDGSQDKSWQVISDLAEKYAFVRGLNLMRNYGQHNALLAGIRAAQNEVIVTIDDDLQHPPEEIPKMLDKLAEGYDVVYGTPEKRQHGLWRNIASEIIRLILQGVVGADTARKAGPGGRHALPPFPCGMIPGRRGGPVIRFVSWSLMVLT